jgi:hypothetical protein
MTYHVLPSLVLAVQDNIGQSSPIFKSDFLLASGAIYIFSSGTILKLCNELVKLSFLKTNNSLKQYL